MKRSIFTFLLIATAAAANAQSVVSGKITNAEGAPVPSASVRIKGSGRGVNADTAGVYSITTSLTGKRVLEVSSIGYGLKEIPVQLADTPITLNIVLLDEASQLQDVVVVGAGSFEASDRAKGASLTPMDAMTVAGNGGDIAMSLRSLPGSQQVGEREGLFVRGGTGAETKQFVDGALLKNPNYPSVPGIVQPARLNPFLFKGVLFNTGGYSALYGQALSSALILETIDLPQQSEASLHVFPSSVGAGFQQLSKNKRSSYGVNAQYGNNSLYNNIVKQKQDFFRSPLYISADANFRIKTSNTGMLKFYTNYGYNHTGFRNPDLDSLSLFSSFENKGSNVYANLSYKESLSPKWKIDAAVAYNYSSQKIINGLEDSTQKPAHIPYYPYDFKNRNKDISSDFVQARAVLTRKLGHNQALRFGAEDFYTSDRYLSNDTARQLNDHLTAAFVETDVYFSKNIAAKIGLRAENSSLLNEINVAPRVSLAYRFAGGGQINMAYGIFYQKPDLDYLVQKSDLDYLRATHYIINYQKKANNRLLRIEAYYKKYHGLVTTYPSTSNAGDGYAKGVEVFFRDKKTFKDFDYWITYTYLDTKRRHNNYPYALPPEYATPHTASVAIKRYFQDLNFNVNLSYAVATGRPYYNFQTDETGKPYVFNNGKTNMYHQMNLSFAYLFKMFNRWKQPAFAGLGLGINNVLGSRSVFGYNYSFNGVNKAPITLPATRSYYFGIFMSFGIDRRDDFLDNNL
jgi:hypothetical protein